MKLNIARDFEPNLVRVELFPKIPQLLIKLLSVVFQVGKPDPKSAVTPMSIGLKTAKDQSFSMRYIYMTLYHEGLMSYILSKFQLFIFFLFLKP